MAYGGRFIDWLRSLTAKTTSIDGTEQVHIDSSGLSMKATLANVIRYGGGSPRNATAGNATVTQTTDGALYLEVAGQTAGNARGPGAFDWQSDRAFAVDVASGIRSFAMGFRNRATGESSTAMGYYTYANAPYAFACGRSTNASLVSQFAFGYGPTKGLAQAQGSLITLYQTTANDTPTVMSIGGDASLRVNIYASQTYNIYGLITAMSDSTDGHKVKSWEIKVTITSDASNNTRIVGTPITIVTAADTEATSWNISGITADDTNEALSIAVTGEAGTNIRWQATLFISMVGF